MSGVAVIVALLSADAAIRAIVDPKNIVGGKLPVGSMPPSLSVSQISATPRNAVGMTEVKVITERVQVTVIATSYPQQKALLPLLRAACPNQRGVVGGVHVSSVVPESEGPDLSGITGEYEQSMDFFVRWSP